MDIVTRMNIEKTNWKKLNTKDDTWFHFYALLKMSEFYAM